jgi:hypothetical protein
MAAVSVVVAEYDLAWPGGCVWALICEADRWAWDVAWVAGASDH